MATGYEEFESKMKKTSELLTVSLCLCACRPGERRRA